MFGGYLAGDSVVRVWLASWASPGGKCLLSQPCGCLLLFVSLASTASNLLIPLVSFASLATTTSS